MWLERRTRAILRSAEFGFFGVIVRTIVQTPRFWGAPLRSCTKRRSSEFHVVRRAGVSTFGFWLFRPLRTSCEIVGMRRYPFLCAARANARLTRSAFSDNSPRRGRLPYGEGPRRSATDVTKSD